MQPSKAVTSKIDELCKLICDIDDNHLVRKALAAEAGMALFHGFSESLDMTQSERDTVASAALTGAQISLSDLQTVGTGPSRVAA